MSELIYYARRVAETRGFEHLACLEALRTYMRHHEERLLLQAVTQISEPKHIRALWEAGLPPRMQEAVLRRYEELELRRG